MPSSAPWAAWRRILSCKEDAHAAVHDPKAICASAPASIDIAAAKKAGSDRNHCKGHATICQAKKRRSTGSSACCHDLRSVVHGNTRVMHRADQDSPLAHHPHQLKVLLREPCPLLLHSPRSLHRRKASASAGGDDCSDCSIASACKPSASFPSAICVGLQSRQNGDVYLPTNCHKCGASVEDAPDALEAHYATHHAVTELKEGDSARSIVEIIFQTSWLRQDIPFARPERIFKVHNSPKTVAKFEDYREMVKLKASKISKKHSRCLVDGNELLRFYSTTVACRLGRSCLSTASNSPWTTSLCASTSCGVCQILKNGFATKGKPGIYTNASSCKAHESLVLTSEYVNMVNMKHAMLICRVIAGRVEKSGYESSQGGPASGYDSVAGEAGLYTDMEELLVFNNKAILPCFVVVYSH